MKRLSWMSKAQAQVIVRPAATNDLDDIIDYYLAEAGTAQAARFSEILGAALDLIARNPGIGSPVLGEKLTIAGLRTCR